MISLPPSSCREEEEIDEYRVSPLLPPAVKGVEIGVEEEKRRSVLPFRPSLIRPSILLLLRLDLLPVGQGNGEAPPFLLLLRRDFPGGEKGGEEGKRMKKGSRRKNLGARTKKPFG